MGFYALKRLGLALLIVACALVLLFSLLHMVPGDPVSIALGPRATPEAQARYIEKMHLNDPLLVQLAIFVGNALRGDLGVDIFSERSVTLIVLDQLRFTIVLAVAGLGWAALLGVPLGCISAVRQGSWLDRITAVLSVGTIAVPSFLVSIWALLIFAIMLRWLPVIGAGEPGDLMDQLHHLILPAFAVGLGWVGYLARIVRASMLEVMGENYIRAARAFGLPQRTVVYRYALKVAILPTITLVGMGFGNLLSGAVFAEIIFSRPGVGKLIFDMVMNRNFPVVQGAVLITAVLYLVTTLIADLVVAWLDPRVRESL
jgi:peptide/nickel transport system permease protein